MKYFILLLLTSCGVNGSSNSTHKVQVEGSAEIEHRIVIDFEVCDDLQPADKAVCIDKVLEAIKGLSKQSGGAE